MTAGAIFDKTRTPLTVWLRASWLFASAEDGISAQHLRHALEIGSHPTHGVGDVAPAAVCAGAAGPGPAGCSGALPYHGCPLSA